MKIEQPIAMAEETYRLAHTVRCKLSMAADRPDRNLRFLLGHAFTLDKLMLRIVEIESESSDEDVEEVADGHDLPSCTARRVSFRSSHAKPVGIRKKSPPPQPEAEEDDEDAVEDEDDEDEGLSLRRFESATAKPPRMIEDDGDEEEDELKSPELSSAELEVITQGPDNEDLVDLYGFVKECPCHGHRGESPDVVKAWDIPQKEDGKRIAIVQVA